MGVYGPDRYGVLKPGVTASVVVVVVVVMLMRLSLWVPRPKEFEIKAISIER